METKTKQRALGAGVMLIVLGAIITFLFAHPLAGMSEAEMASPGEQTDGQVVYDLNLQPATSSEAAVDEDELVPLHPLSEAELRSRAAATNQVSTKLLRTSSSPVVLDEKNKDSLKDPLKDSLKEKELEETTLSELQHDDAANPVAQQNSPRDSQTNTISSTAVPLAWVVQLGSFSDKENVQRLLSTLKQMKLDAYTRVINHDDQVTIKVFVGPYINRQDVDKVQQSLQRALNLKGVIKKYSLT